MFFPSSSHTYGVPDVQEVIWEGGKQFYAVHEDMQELFLSAWKKAKVDYLPSEANKLSKAIHDTIRNFRKKHVNPHIEVSSP